jgi:gliding motility-associated-like protein
MLCLYEKKNKFGAIKKLNHLNFILMKRILLLSTMFVLLFIGKGYSQFVEDFEGGIPADWATFKTLNGTLSTAGNVPGWATSTTSICEGTTSAYIDRLNIGAGNVSEGWLVTPQITVPPNGRLYFTAKQTYAQDYGTKYIVKISTTSQTEISSFTQVLELNESQLSPLGWDQCFNHGVDPIIDISAYSGQDVYIAFIKKDSQPAAAPYADRMVLDLVKVLEQCMPPTNLGASAGSTTASLTWLGTASDGWEVEVLEGTNVPGTGFPTHTGTEVPFDITGLTDSTPHTYYVRANCGDSTSPWAGPFTFTTQQIPVTLPYSTDFEAASHGWQFANGTQVNKWVVGTAASNSPTHSLYISNTNGSSNNYLNTTNSTVFAYRDVQIPVDATEIYFSFDWRGMGDSNDYFKLWHTPVTYNPIPGTSMTPLGSNGTQVGGVNHFNNPAWINTGYVIPITPALQGTVRRFIFEWRNNNSGGVQPPAAIDNINISVITCSAPPVAGLNASGVTTSSSAPFTSSATFSWNAANPVPASYDYYLSTSSATPDASTVASGNVAATTVTIDDLDPATSYYFWVRSNCGGADGTSFWVGPVVITTPPSVISLEQDYYTNFEEANPGWALSGGMQVNKWAIGTAVSNSPTHSLYVSNNNGANNTYTLEAASVVHAYKDFAVPAGTSQIYLSYDWRNAGQTGSDYIRVWTVPATYTPTPGTQITAGTGRQQFGGNHVGQPNWTNSGPLVVNATPYENSVVRLVFEWRNDASGGTQPPGAVDNITFSVITCPAPSGLAVSGTPTIDSANLTWNGTGSLYEYYVSTSSSSPSPTTTPTGDTANTNVGLTDLDDATTYYFWIRSNCGSDGVSFWVGPVVFTTPQIPATMNFYDNFEGPIKWGFSNGTQPNKWVVGTATSNSPTHSLYISNDNGATNTYTTTTSSVTHAYRDIIVPADAVEAIVSFAWKSRGEGATFDYMRVWLVPNNFNPVAGTQITAGGNRIQIGANFLNQPEWTVFTQIVNLGATYPGNTARLVFEWRNDGSGGSQPPAAVDGVTFNVLTCPAPINLTAEIVDGSLSVDLAWTPTGSETQWELIIQETGDGVPSPEATGIIVNEPNYTFLAENDVLYEFYVRAICDAATDDISLWSIPGNFSIFVPPGCATIDVVGVGVEITDSTVVLCPEMNTDVSLEASFFGIAATDSYAVEQIAYAPPFPFIGGDVLNVTTDDVWSPVVNLPFNFCFFGSTFSQAKVGSNGVVMFGNGMANGGNCPWAFTQTIPNTGFPIKNAIYGVYQDTHPTTTAGVINYQVLGTYPCRALVVNFYELPQFSCGTSVGLQTSQIVIYEISNIIEVYIGNRTSCTTWNSGSGVVGIQNAAGTQAYVPPGRNTGTWSAQNEAWRFVPTGESDVQLQWLKDGVFYSNDEQITVNLTPEELQQLEDEGTLTIEMTAQATYATCTPGEEVTKAQTIDIIYISSLPTTDPLDLEECSATGDEEFNLLLNTDYVLGSLDPAAFLFTYYTSEELAQAGDLTTAIQNPNDPDYPNLVQNYPGLCDEIVWMRIADATNSCFIVKSFRLICGDLSTPNVEFDYPEHIFCNLENTVMVSQLPVSVGGIYTADPAGLSINSTTGTINIAGSTPGVYQVTYTLLPNSCTTGDDYTVEIEIIEPTASVVDFSYDEVCINAINDPLPVLASGFANGGVFTSDSLVVNPNSGEINLDTATIGTHTITYTVGPDAVNCTSGGTSTATIVIVEGTPSVTGFSYDAVYCYSDETATPTMVADYTAGGTFSATPSGLSLNAQTGVIDVMTSTPGTYVVTYAVAEDPSICLNAGNSSFTVTIFGEVPVAVSDECRGNAYWIIASPVDDSYIPEEVIDYTWIVNGVTTTTDVPEFNVSANMGDNVLPLTVTVIVNNGCDNYAQFTVTSTSCMIQKGISPNGDGKNESFDLTGMGVKKLSIYSRYGREVYTKSNYVNEWIGQDKNDNELPTGTYFYSIERSNGENVTGWIYVNRSY